MHCHHIFHNRKRIIIVCTIIFICALALGLGKIIGGSVFGARPSEVGQRRSEKTPALERFRVEAPPVHQQMDRSSSSQLRLLAAHEKRLGRGFAANMVFAEIPQDSTAAYATASYLADILKEHARYGIEPLVAFEPGSMDLRSVDAGAMGLLFTQLKAQGVTAAQAGTWMPFPEPNIPEWGAPDDTGNTDPALFARNYSLASRALKQVFPSAQAAVLLDSATYPMHDTDYANGTYASEALVQYLNGIPKDLIDAVSLQGFPWGENGIALKYDPAQFLQADAAIALARKAGTKNVWLTTGTFKSMYDWDPKLRVTASPTLRKEILTGIVEQASRIQEAGFYVTLHIFAENKAATEANWAYDDAASWGVLKDFTGTVQERGIGLTFFDLPK